MMFCEEPTKGLILHSGAIGDCLLTLPLATFMKRAYGLRQVHFMGRLQAVGFYPRRSCVDYVRAMESVPLHRLFEPQEAFTLDDPDGLIAAFKGYGQIVSFLGAGHSDFEQNLLMTVHCSHSAEVIMLPLVPAGVSQEPVSQFYIRSLAEQSGLDVPPMDVAAVWLNPTAEDQLAGRDILKEAGVDPDASAAVIHPGSGGRHKCWHPENFIRLGNALAERDIQPLFLFGPAEEERLGPETRRQFQDAGPVVTGLTLTEAVGLLTQADLFIGNDSGISHIAGAMGIKTAAVFGSTDSVTYRPLGPAVTVFQAKLKGFEGPCQDEVDALLGQLAALF